MARYPDGSLPNHYSHDSLGCPYECDDEHNHPEPIVKVSEDPKFKDLDRVEKVIVVVILALIVISAAMLGAGAGYGIGALIDYLN